jgi:hypothetical protein
MHPDRRLDELGHEIFRLAIFRGESSESAAQLAMSDPLAKRKKIQAELADGLLHELDWVADDCQMERRQQPIRTVKAMVEADDFLITPRCCDEYREITPRAKSRSSSELLRKEVCAGGRFVPRRENYLRVLVPRRFVLHVERSADGFLEATKLTRPRQRPQRSKHRWPRNGR